MLQSASFCMECPFKSCSLLNRITISNPWNQVESWTAHNGFAAQQISLFTYFNKTKLPLCSLLPSPTKELVQSDERLRKIEKWTVMFKETEKKINVFAIEASLTLDIFTS